MKKITLLFLLIAAVGFAQKVSLTPELSTALTAKTWVADYAMMNGLKVKQMPSGMKMQLQFRKNKTYTIVNNNRVSRKGTWSYDEKYKCIHMIIGGNEGSKVVELGKKELVLTLQGGKEIDGKVTTFDIHFKPKGAHR